jgi:RHS repeat-associated protein
VLYTYDAFARRIRKEIIPAERRDYPAMVKLALAAGKDALPKSRVVEFLWDGDVLAGELDAEDGARFFVHDPGTFLPLLQQEKGAVFTYVNDHLGTPKELVDQDGRVAWAATHSAWGRVVEVQRDPQAKRAVESPFRLLGQYHDAETGLCYTRFRYFDAALGRWCSPDPLGLVGSPNLLGFDGSPTSNADPLGLVSWSCTKKKSNVENAFGHWQKHRDEFPELQNAKQYVEQAKDFTNSPPPTSLVKTRANGETVIYDPNTNTFGVKTPAGDPKTMFRPDPAEHGYPTNEDYFRAQ